MSQSAPRPNAPASPAATLTMSKTKLATHAPIGIVTSNGWNG
jgi:hypothetical protein